MRRKTCSPIPKQGPSISRPETLGPPAHSLCRSQPVPAVRMFSANSKVPSPPWASSLGLFGHQLLSSSLDSRVIWNCQECVHVTVWPVAPPLTHAHAEASKAMCTASCLAGAVLFLEVLLTGGHRLQGAEISFKENRDPSAGEAFLQGHGEDHQPAEV